MASKLVSIDTNIIMRLILNDVPEQYETAKALIFESGVSCYVSDLAITEVVFNLEGPRYKFERSLIVEALSAVLSEQNLHFDEELFSEVFELYVKHPKLSFNDCYLACKIEKMGRTPLYSFDKKLVAQVRSVEEVPAR